ncbi:MAG: GtrA family protein [Pseudomonadota bacterium]
MTVSGAVEPVHRGLTAQSLVLRYGLFAVIATVANLAAQRLVLSLGPDGSEGAMLFAGAVGAGTLVGLVIKYLLDKRWIFFDEATGVRAHGQKFSLYTAMGVVTTLIFWGVETVFWLVWQTHLMREIGAVIGLSIGYVIKYQLDRRFVFTQATLPAEAAQ